MNIKLLLLTLLLLTGCDGNSIFGDGAGNGTTAPEQIPTTTSNSITVGGDCDPAGSGFICDDDSSCFSFDAAGIQNEVPCRDVLWDPESQTTGLPLGALSGPQGSPVTFSAVPPGTYTVTQTVVHSDGVTDRTAVHFVTVVGK